MKRILLFLALGGMLACGRRAYEGFEWTGLSGAGLQLKVQTNENIRFLADPSLPGIVMVRNGDSSPQMKIRVFDLPSNDISDVLKYLETTDGWDMSQTCAFREIPSGRRGISRYVLVPDGEYAVSAAREMESSPVPCTCNGWGEGNSGHRYFEVHENNPGKAIFVEIGQDAPLFDENSIEFTEAPRQQGFSTDILYTMDGTVRLGHEVRSFIPSGSDREYWIVDRTGLLKDKYDMMTGGTMNGKPVRAVLKLEYNGRWEDGFAAEYDGVFLVREVVALGQAPEVLPYDNTEKTDKF